MLGSVGECEKMVCVVRWLLCACSCVGVKQKEWCVGKSGGKERLRVWRLLCVGGAALCCAVVLHLLLFLSSLPLFPLGLRNG